MKLIPFLKKYKRFYLFQSIFIFSPIFAFTQSFPDTPSQINEIPPSPTMTEFQKYGSYPVSKHTGVPNISIPIYTISLKGVELPINLSYHASGIKVDQQASWVGLGWNLNAGGAITRTVRGSADETQNGFIDYPYYEEGEFDAAADYYKTEEMMKGIIDTEPDVFNYNFLGYSGRFTFNSSDVRTNATISLIPHNDLKITPIFSGANLTGFIVITPEGIKAEFGDYETSEEYRGEGNLGSTIIRASSTWHLKKLTTPFNREITFEYKLVPGYNPSSPGGVNVPNFTRTSSINYFDPCQPYQYRIEGSNSNSGINYYGVKRVTKINFPEGYISFQSSSGNRIDDPDNESLRLDEIEIYSKVNGVSNLKKKYNLNYDYFGSVDSNAPNPEYQVRQKLTTITEEGLGGLIKNPYVFDYKEGGAQNDLPPRFSSSQDYWGYYNGKSNSTLVPRFAITTSSGSTVYLGDANREADPNFSQAGMLEKITFPTQGFTKFTFENNSASVYEGGIYNQYITGGLRIKNIISYDSDSNPEWQKSYEYTNPDSPLESSGVYNGFSYVTPQDYYSGWTYYFASNVGPGSCQASTFNAGYHTNSEGVSSTVKRSNNFASVFYKAVKEINGSPSDFKGYTWFHYDVNKDYFMQGLGPGMAFSIDRSWDRGQLILEEVFENGSLDPVVTKTFNYENIEIQPAISGYKAGSRFNVQSLGYVPPEQQSYPYNFRSQQYFLTYYEEPIIWKRIKSSSVMKDGITRNTEYFYNSKALTHTNVQKIRTYNSDGESLETKFYYPQDIVNTTSLLEGGSLSSNNVINIDRLKKDDLYRPSEIIQKVQIKNGNVTGIERNLYSSFGNLIMPSKMSIAKGNNSVDSRMQIHAYDSQGNIIEISKTDGIHIVYIWGYENTSPIAKIENATAAEVAQALGVSISELEVNINENNIGQIDGLRQLLPDAMITTYTHTPLIGVKTITDPKGQTTRYDYDDFGRLKQVKDHDYSLLQEYKYNYKQ